MRACASVAAVASITSLASISGQTQYAWRPARTSDRMRSITSSRRRIDTSFVTTGRRPGGSSSITETSRSAR